MDTILTPLEAKTLLEANRLLVSIGEREITVQEFVEMTERAKRYRVDFQRRVARELNPLSPAWH